MNRDWRTLEDSLEDLTKRVTTKRALVVSALGLGSIIIAGNLCGDTVEKVLYFIAFPYALISSFAIIHRAICKLESFLFSRLTSFRDDIFGKTVNPIKHNDCSETQDNTSSQQQQELHNFDENNNGKSKDNTAKNEIKKNFFRSQPPTFTSSRHIIIILSNICIRAYHLLRRLSTKTR